MWNKAFHGSTVSPGEPVFPPLPIPHPKPELHNQEVVTAETQSRMRDQQKQINN